MEQSKATEYGSRKASPDVVRSLPFPKYYSVDKSEKNEVGGACDRCGVRRYECKVLVRGPKGKSPLGRI
jgi:hypothetical protein